MLAPKAMPAPAQDPPVYVRQPAEAVFGIDHQPIVSGDCPWSTGPGASYASARPYSPEVVGPGTMPGDVLGRVMAAYESLDLILGR